MINKWIFCRIIWINGWSVRLLESCRRIKGKEKKLNWKGNCCIWHSHLHIDGKITFFTWNVPTKLNEGKKLKIPAIRHKHRFRSFNLSIYLEKEKPSPIPNSQIYCRKKESPSFEPVEICWNIFLSHFDSICTENNVEHWTLSGNETCASLYIVVSLKLVQTNKFNNMSLRLDLFKSTPKIVYADAFTRFTFVIPIYWWESFRYWCKTDKKRTEIWYTIESTILALNRLMGKSKQKINAVLKHKLFTMDVYIVKFGV